MDFERNKIFVLLILWIELCSASPDLTNIPDYDLDMPDLIRKYNYPAEAHTVTTDDGYILSLHRIPCSPKSNITCINRPVVFLHHTLLGSSACWLIMGPEKSLPFLLADEGYDVWLGNARGNKYSRKHKIMRPYQSRFWNFSWHEIGVYDLPASIDHILDVTKQKNMYYIGHSMGSTIFFVLMSLKPEYNSKIKLMISIAPIAYTGHVEHSLFRLAALSEVGEKADRKYNQELFPSSKRRNGLLRQLCGDGSIVQEVCSTTIFFYAGLDFTQLNRTMLPTILSHFPAGSSLKTWVHYGQGMTSEQFRQYDHGLILNKMYYGQPEPPKYNLSMVTSPVSIHYSEYDIISISEDIDILLNELPNIVSRTIVPLPLFSHLDFLWGIDVKTVAYDEIINVIKTFKIPYIM